MGEGAKGVSRRGFLKGATAIGASAAVGTLLASCAQEEPKKAGVPDTWDYETDVVVMGFGGSGAVASIEAARQGAQVMLFEKAPEKYAGGNTICSSASCKIPNNPQSAFDFVRNIVLDTVTDDEISGIIEEGEGIVDWLLEACDHEATIVDISKGNYGGVPYGDSFNMIAFGTGINLFEMLKENVLAQENIQVSYESPVTGLICDPETKEVYGVKILQGGAEKTVKAKRGVVLACGGFEADSRMVQDFAQPEVEMYFLGTPYNTGDGLKLLTEVDARIRHSSSVEFGAHCVRKASADAGIAIAVGNSYENLTNLIFVNKGAKRFMNETRPSSVSHAHPAHDKSTFEELLYDGVNLGYKNYPYYFIFDESRRAQGPLADWASVESKGSYAGVHQISPWSMDNLAEIEKGYIVKADTIEELAGKIGLDPETLAKTVADYNAACAAGEGDEMGRTKNLMPIETPPFYASEMALAYLNTFAGPERNSKHEVINWDGEPVKRLYAVGEFGSTWSRLYPGASNIPEVLGSYSAGREVAALEPWEA